VLVDIPQPVEDKADIVVTLSLLRSASGILPRSFADRLNRSTNGYPKRIVRNPTPEDLGAPQLRLLVLRRRPIVAVCVIALGTTLERRGRWTNRCGKLSIANAARCQDRRPTRYRQS
jgi:hypothetical protein